MKSHLLLFGLVLGIASPTVLRACSCSWDLPQHFCESLSYWPAPSRPTTVVLAVKLNNVAHGMDMKVVDRLYGHANDTIRVWGDPGHLCRPYTDGIPIGDTMVLALDSLGYFYDIEQDGDYAINICGVFYLFYENGMVNGRVFEAQQQQIDYAVFKDSVLNADCNPDKITGLAERTLDGLAIRYDVAARQLLFMGQQRPLKVSVYDVSGKQLLNSLVSPDDKRLAIPTISAGVYLVEVQSGTARSVQRVLVGW